MSENQRILTTDEIEEARVRLQVEKIEFDKESFRCGEREGKDWALNAKYEDFKRLEFYARETELSEINPWLNVMICVAGSLGMDIEAAYASDGMMVDEERLANGFVHSAMEAWESIKPKLV